MVSQVSPSEAFAGRVLESLATPLAVLDDALHVHYLNPAAEDLFSVSARRLRQRPLETLILDVAPLEEIRRRMRETHSPITRREVRLPLAAGGTVVCDVMMGPLEDPDRSDLLLMELARRDHVARADRDVRLVEQQAILDKLLRGLAHEVKNPLGGLRGAAQLLEAELPNPALREYTQVIIREADRLQDLVDHILGPRRGLRRARVNVHEILEHVRTLVAMDLPAGIHIERDYDPSVPELHLDRDQMVQALLNVVQNAVQALEGGGHITLRTRIDRYVTLGPRTVRLALRIEVEDDGPGVPEAIRDEIFFPMVSGRAEGTGLGLSIAQTVINRHGGLIQCESEPGRTVFSILLPLDGGTDEEVNHGG